MLVSARTTFALRCAQCGNIEMVSVSRFEFHPGASVKIHCSCGSHMATAGMKQKQVWLQIPCYLCDGTHFLYYGSRDFWADELKQVACAETDLQLGVFGGEQEVEAYAHPGATELDRLVGDEAFDDYFDHREVMYLALNRVNTLSEEGNVICSCGSRRISVDIYPDQLELSCDECGRSRSVYASTGDDLDALERVARIEVGGDAPNRRKGHKK